MSSHPAPRLEAETGGRGATPELGVAKRGHLHLRHDAEPTQKAGALEARGVAQARGSVNLLVSRD